MKRMMMIIAALVAVVLGASMVSGCSTSAKSASCAFVVGNGQNGNDTKFDRVIWPGQSVGSESGKDVTYVPCNSRNYITNDGSVKDANGNKVGDRSTPTIAYTKTGVQIKVWTTVAFTLNQSEDAMKNFYALCFKYTCADTKDQGGDANSSTPGWNSMLGENFGPTVDAAAAKAAFSLDDSIWQKHDPALYEELAKQVAGSFDDIMRQKVGYQQDLFCGSGNSQWKDPENPGGKGNTFTCSQVRVTVDKVERGENNGSDGTAGAQELNKQRLANAQQIYGDSASFWLGLMDAIDHCKAANVTCVLNIGGAGSPSVPVPSGH